LNDGQAAMPTRPTSPSRSASRACKAPISARR
jgi:hypothetical protein